MILNTYFLETEAKSKFARKCKVVFNILFEFDKDVVDE